MLFLKTQASHCGQILVRQFPFIVLCWFILFIILIVFLESTAVNENKTTVSGGCKEMQREENVAVFCATASKIVVFDELILCTVDSAI